MKKILCRTLISVFAATAVVSLMPGCATVESNNAAIAKSQKEMLLTEAGFRTRTVTTPAQQQQVNQLAPNRVSAVKYKGKLYYVYPSGQKDQIYVGNQAQFDAYKQALEGKKASLQAEQSAQMLAGSPTWVGETAGPNHIEVQTFTSFGSLDPMEGDN
jgi:hypothetical protein